MVELGMTIKRARLSMVLFASLLLGFSVIEAQGSPTFRAAPPDPDMGKLVAFADGFTRPLYLTHAGDGSRRLFVVEQGGKVWIIQDGARLPEPFLDISVEVSQEAVAPTGYTERGLLGLAFHPNYAQNGIFFVDYTDRSGNTVLARMTVSANNPNQADAASEQPILHVEQPYPNHNGGDIAFGPDGFLYVALGDGGSAGDPQGNGQNLDTLLGSILRLNVDVTEGETYTVPSDNPFVDRSGARPEIFIYGVRNPWRFSFDRLTGDLYVGDVGQNNYEEVDFISAGQSGLNLGWNIFEATHPYSGAPAPANMTLPIAEYSHSLGISITGGYVYRGDRIPDWQGAYLYGDFGSGIIWAAYRSTPDQWMSSVLKDTNYTISSFGEDESGELYLVDYNGSVMQFVAP